jgi:hypothetical protein
VSTKNSFLSAPISVHIINKHRMGGADRRTHTSRGEADDCCVERSRLRRSDRAKFVRMSAALASSC